jgi:hypothetical protein
MGRRKKADLLDLVEKIVHLYEDEKMTFSEIEERLNSEGVDIGRSAIHKAYRDYHSMAEEYKKLSEETKGLLDTLKENPTTDMMEGIHALMVNHLFEFIRNIDHLDFEEPGDLILSINRLSRTSEKLTKFRIERLKETAEKIENEGLKRNIDPEFLKLMKQEIYGIQ